jgi:DNA-binding LacI/PurR family transcriptional regulator
MTLAAIGRRAGVSKATVSKVLNGRDGVSSATRERVQALLQSYGYTLPEPGAGAPRSNLIDVLVVGHQQPWAAVRLLSQLGRAASRRGYDVVSLPSDPIVDHEALTRILARGSRGVVVMFGDLPAAQRHRLAAHGVPTVLVESPVPVGQPTRSIEIDYRGGIRSATEHLIAGGHRRIALALAGRDDRVSRQMFRGYTDAIRAARLRFDEALIRSGEATPWSTAAHARALLELDDRPTAVIAASDLMAVGIYGALESKGLQVGRDLAVVAFSDRPEVDWLRPQLSTLEVSIGQLTSAILDLLADPSGEHAVKVDVRLVVRESSAWRFLEQTGT